MTYCRLIAPQWLQQKNAKAVIEGQFSQEEIQQYNSQGYNVFFTPNHPETYGKPPISGKDIDVFECVFIDCDLKDGIYVSKEDFLFTLALFELKPSYVVDSGHGIHAYWKVSDLDAKSFLRLSRRLCRKFKTDEAVGQIFQLMRLPGTLNTKVENHPVLCKVLEENEAVYTCEELNAVLPVISQEDEAYCQLHYNNTYSIKDPEDVLDDRMPERWGRLLNSSTEAKDLWVSTTDDRSKNDFRLGHIMYGHGFTKEEAMIVLANTAKSLRRAPVHRVSYARNIVDKIWTFESSSEKVEDLDLSFSVKDILKRNQNSPKGIKFPCHKRIDNTVHGFRLGQVLGLVAGSGVGKSAFALNMFKWFSEENPNYHHFFVPLEQPAHEIASRWETLSSGNTSLNDKVHIISNYAEDGTFRNLSLSEIQKYIIKFQETKKVKIGCVVIDHIGVLKMKDETGQKQDLMDVCHSMKAFAVQTDTFLIMQSQTSREKAGIGDIELDKDAAYGTVFFESYCDYLVTLWQPLKRCHSEEACPTVTAFKFCKIREKKIKKDVIKEDVPYYFYFDSEIENLRDMTEDEEQSFKFFLSRAVSKRSADKKTNLTEYRGVPYGGAESSKIDSNRQGTRH
jgi:hypothetical protein